MWLGRRRRHSRNADGSEVDNVIVRRGQFLVRPAACRLVLHYSWLACDNRVAFRQSYQVTLSRPLGLSLEEGQEFCGCVMCGSQPRQHHLQTDKEPFDVQLLTKCEFCPKNTLKIPRVRVHVKNLHLRFRTVFHGSITRGSHCYVV